MTDLGELGVPKPKRDDTFTWFGEKIRVGPTFTELQLIDFLERARGIDANDPSNMLVVTDFLKVMVHEEDWDRFWSTSIAEGQEMTDLMELMKAITQRKAARPTRRRSGSSPGRRETKGKSRGSSSSPVTRRLVRAGRPDLALVVEQAETDRARRSVG